MNAIETIMAGKDGIPWKMEPHYSTFVSAMTGEDLHEKSDIALVLAFQAQRLERLSESVIELHEDNRSLRFDLAKAEELTLASQNVVREIIIALRLDGGKDATVAGVVLWAKFMRAELDSAKVNIAELEALYEEARTCPHCEDVIFSVGVSCCCGWLPVLKGKGATGDV